MQKIKVYQLAKKGKYETTNKNTTLVLQTELEKSTDVKSIAIAGDGNPDKH